MTDDAALEPGDCYKHCPSCGVVGTAMDVCPLCQGPVQPAPVNPKREA